MPDAGPGGRDGAAILVTAARKGEGDPTLPSSDGQRGALPFNAKTLISCALICFAISDASIATEANVATDQSQALLGCWERRDAQTRNKLTICFHANGKADGGNLEAGSMHLFEAAWTSNALTFLPNGSTCKLSLKSNNSVLFLDDCPWHGSLSRRQ